MRQQLSAPKVLSLTRPRYEVHQAQLEHGIRAWIESASVGPFEQ
jgi:hypothetical protein